MFSAIVCCNQRVVAMTITPPSVMADEISEANHASHFGRYGIPLPISMNAGGRRSPRAGTRRPHGMSVIVDAPKGSSSGVKKACFEGIAGSEACRAAAKIACAE